MSVIVSDTSPLHYLILCEEIAILPRLFNQVLIPPTVYAELVHPNAPLIVSEWARHIPSWVSVQKPKALDLTLNIDRGELEAICLARETNASAILIDDFKGRTVALRCGLLVTGTVGVLEAAAARGWLDLITVMDKLKRTNARLSPAMIQAALERDQIRRQK